MNELSAVKKLKLVALLCLLAAALAVPQPVSASGNGIEPVIEGRATLTGSVTCSGRVNHRYTCKRYDTPMSCTLSCVQAGGDFVLLVGDKSYALKGADEKLKSFAGGKATVSGSASGGAIEVSTVEKVSRNR